MPLLVTSAAGANGNGYGTLLAFDLNGRSLGAFSGDSRIADPRGLAVDRDEVSEEFGLGGGTFPWLIYTCRLKKLLMRDKRSCCSIGIS